jgi:aminopeptidase N
VEVDARFIDAFRAILRHPELDAAFKELVLTLPSEAYVAEQLVVVDPQRIHEVREGLKLQLAHALHEDWAWAYEHHQDTGGYSPDPVSAGRRALTNLALSMLVLHDTVRGNPIWTGKAFQRFKDAANMTDRLGALAALVQRPFGPGSIGLGSLPCAVQGRSPGHRQVVCPASQRV